jgi:hypothetical protein
LTSVGLRPSYGLIDTGVLARNSRRSRTTISTEALPLDDRGAVIKPWLRYAILVYLWVALAEDTVLFVLAWIAPDLWFRLLHASIPAGLEMALLRRSAGQWGRSPWRKRSR